MLENFWGVLQCVKLEKKLNKINSINVFDLLGENYFLRFYSL